MSNPDYTDRNMEYDGKIRWQQPVPVSDLTAAFPANVIGRLMPTWEEIPDEFKQFKNPWVQLAERWFYQGLTGDEFRVKEGIDYAMAVRHLGVVLRSFQPKQEHKIAAVAYLMSAWCDERKV